MKKQYLAAMLFSLWVMICSCSKDQFRGNPLDPNANLDPAEWAPEKLQIVQVNIHTVKLTWKRTDERINGFKIDRKIGNEEWQGAYAAVAKNVYEYSDTNAVPADTNTYRVYAYAGENISSSVEASMIIPFPSPSNLQIRQINLTDIRLTWIDNSDGEDGFKIDRKIGSNEWEIAMAVLDANTVFWRDSSAIPEVTHHYYVYAFKGEKISIHTDACINNIIPTPTNLVADIINDRSLRLAWTDNTGYEFGFRIERNNGSGFLPIGEVSANVTTYTDLDLTYGQGYSYRVKAFVANFESDYSIESNLVEMIIPSPTNLEAEVFDRLSVTLIWCDNCAFEIGYKVERKNINGTYAEIADLDSNIKTYTDQGLSIYSTYVYRILAYTQYNLSNYSNEMEIGIAPDNFVYISGGTFTMGDVWGDGSSDEIPTHEVTVSGFFISKYEVKQRQFKDIMGYEGSWTASDHGIGLDNPAYWINWDIAVAFCNRISERSGFMPCYTITETDVVCDFSQNGYRLPTEAEWEYAARSKGREDRKWSGTNTLSEIGVFAWYDFYISDAKCHPVGLKKPNELGIFDMSGNAEELCWDWYDRYSPSNQINPTGPLSGSYHVARGGNWSGGSDRCRTVNREELSGSIWTGFRIVKIP